MSDPSLERVASTLSPSLSWVCLMSEAGIRTAKLFPHLDINEKSFHHRYTSMYIYIRRVFSLCPATPANSGH